MLPFVLLNLLIIQSSYVSENTLWLLYAKLFDFFFMFV